MPADLAFFTSPAAKERLKIDLALLPLYMGLDALLARPALHFGTYDHHVKLQGITSILDGSVQARTGHFTRDYPRGGPAAAHPWHGHPALGPDAVNRMARQANGRRRALYTHETDIRDVHWTTNGFH